MSSRSIEDRISGLESTVSTLVSSMAEFFQRQGAVPSAPVPFSVTPTPVVTAEPVVPVVTSAETPGTPLHDEPDPVIEIVDKDLMLSQAVPERSSLLTTPKIDSSLPADIFGTPPADQSAGLILGGTLPPAEEALSSLGLKELDVGPSSTPVSSGDPAGPPPVMRESAIASRPSVDVSSVSAPVDASTSAPPQPGQRSDSGRSLEDPYASRIDRRLTALSRSDLRDFDRRDHRDWPLDRRSGRDSLDRGSRSSRSDRADRSLREGHYSSQRDYDDYYRGHSLRSDRWERSDYYDRYGRPIRSDRADRRGSSDYYVRHDRLHHDDYYRASYPPYTEADRQRDRPTVVDRSLRERSDLQTDGPTPLRSDHGAIAESPVSTVRHPDHDLPSDPVRQGSSGQSYEQPSVQPSVQPPIQPAIQPAVQQAVQPAVVSVVGPTLDSTGPDHPVSVAASSVPAGSTSTSGLKPAVDFRGIDRAYPPLAPLSFGDPSTSQAQPFKRPSEPDIVASQEAKRVRASSPPRSDAADQDSTFADVRRIIRDAYPNIVPQPEHQERQFASLSEKELSTDPPKEGSVVLPWSEGVVFARKQVQDTAYPDDAAHSLRTGKFIPLPRAAVKHYPVHGVRRPTEGVPANEDFHKISLSSSKSSQISVQLSDAELQSLEEAPRRIQATASTLDWLCATLGKQLKEILPDDHDLTGSVTVPASRLATFRRLLQSASRSVSQVVRDSTAEVANLVLRRRDAHLKKASPRLSEAFRSRLRNAGLFSETLFDQEVFDRATVAVKAEADLLNTVTFAQSVGKLVSAQSSSKQTKTSSASQSQQRQQPQQRRQQQQQQTQQQSQAQSSKKDSKSSSSSSSSTKGSRSYKGKSGNQKRS